MNQLRCFPEKLTEAIPFTLLCSRPGAALRKRGCSSSLGSSQPSSTKAANPRKHCTARTVICIIDTKQHPAVQILSLQSGNLPFPSSSCSLFAPTFHPVKLPPTHPSPSFIPTQALSFSSHQEPDTSTASLHLSALPATYLPLPQAERRSLRNEDI